MNLSIQKRCYVLAVNRSSYYKWLVAKPKPMDDAEQAVLESYHKHKGTYGRMRITQELKNNGRRINHKKVYRIMRKLGIQAVIRKKWSCRKYTKENVVPNLLNREFKVPKPHTKYVCDVTQLKRINDKRYYLYTITDLYNNAIVSYSISFHNDWCLVAKGLERLDIHNNKILLHSDQGSQFTSRLYKSQTQKKNITLSMSRVGNCYDNAPQESLFGHLKEEFYLYYSPQSEDELRRNLQDFIHYYNTERIQMRFKMSPQQYLESQNFVLA